MSKIEDPKLSYDFELSANDINIQFMNQLNLLEPFGMGNEKPLILVKSFNSSCEFNKNFPQYLNINIDKIKVIAFNFKDYYYEINSKCQKDFILDLSLEKYGKSTQIHGILKNIYVEKLGNMNSSTLKFEYLKQIKSINGDSNDYSSYNNINDVLSNINTYFGSLIVCYSYKEYFDLTKNYDLSKFTYFKYFSLNNKFNYNSIIIAPKNLSQYMGYQNIIFLDPLIDSGYIREIRSINKDCHIYLPNNKKFDIGFIGIISLDHNIFKTYYTLFKQNIFAEDELQYYKKINSINKNVNIIQYCFCLMVFEELKIINLVFEERFSIKINKNIKVELKQSKIYNKVALLKKIM